MKKRKKMSDYEISLILTFTGIPVWQQLLYMGSFIPEYIIVPTGLTFLAIWFPAIWQMVSCFFAIQYMRKNPDQQKKAMLCLLLALMVYIIYAVISLLINGMLGSTWHLK